MTTISSLLEGARRLRDGMRGPLVRDVLKVHEQDIVEQQRIQLLEGKDSKGNDMHPFYSEDLKPSGWFRTKDSARRYADWKQTISYPYTVKRNPDAPNLYITGVFHDDLGAEFRDDEMEIVPDTGYAANIMAKYGRNAFGLNPEKWGIIFGEKGAKDDLIKKMKEILWQ
jgi:hypothetical protein